MKTYAFADLHGRFDLLKLAYKMIKRKSANEKARIICLGDFVDRGPESRQIIEFFIERQQNDTQFDWIILQGNHETIMLTAIKSPPHIRWWRANGGNETMKSYGVKPGNNPLWTTSAVPIEHIKWLENLPVVHQDEHRIYVHAGIPLDTEVDEVPTETKQWMLYREDQDNLYGDAEYYGGEGTHISGKHIVHGHHQSEHHPLLKEGRTNLDSFAFFTGRLALGVFDDDVAGGPVETFEVVGECDPLYSPYEWFEMFNENTN